MASGKDQPRFLQTVSQFVGSGFLLPSEKEYNSQQERHGVEAMLPWHFIMVRLIAILLLNCAISYADEPASAPLPTPTEKEVTAVDTFIKSQERIRSHKHLSLNAHEYREARQYLLGSLKGTNVLVVRYTLEESNTWTLYLAVF